MRLPWGIQQTPYYYLGCSLNENNFITMHRWHLSDPIVWTDECRIAIQQISWSGGLKETSDNWCCSTFWYEPLPSAPLPPFPNVEARSADLWPVKK